MNIRYLDTCLPDYFNGFSGQTLAVPLPRRPRAGDVLRGLKDEINACEIWPTPADPDKAYADLYASADEIFDELDLRTSWSKVSPDLSESYAYFGVVKP